jgi:hypothetical protein
MTKLHKLTLDVDGMEVNQTPPFVFERRATSTGMDRLMIDVPDECSDLIGRLANLLLGPLYILYVLHTPRGEGEAGRYQSEELTHEQVQNFLEKYGDFFTGDARHDLWVYSPTSSQTLVWDRHNRLFAEGGPLDEFVNALVCLGFTEGKLAPIGDHYHNYRPEFDADAQGVMKGLDWYRTPLHEDDWQ